MIADGIHPHTRHMSDAVFDLFDSVFGDGSGAARKLTFEWEYEKGSLGKGSELMICWQDGEPIGTAGVLKGELFVDGTPHAADILCDVSCSPRVRGKGVGGRMIECSQHAGGELTIGMGVSPDAWPVLLKKGFVEVPDVFPMFRVLSAHTLFRHRYPIPARDAQLGPPLARVLAGVDRLHPLLTPWVAHGRRHWPHRQDKPPGANTSNPDPSRLERFGTKREGRRQAFEGKISVRSVRKLPDSLDLFMRTLPERWAILMAPDLEALNARYVEHPSHRYHLHVAFRGARVSGLAVWRAYPEPDGTAMGHLSSLWVSPGDDASLDALVIDGLSCLRREGAYAVKALVSTRLMARGLRRHLFVRHGGSPGLFFYTRDTWLGERLKRPWLVHLGTSDIDVR